MAQDDPPNVSLQLEPEPYTLNAQATLLPAPPCDANDELLLAATAQNLRKLAKIFPAPQQTREA